MRANASVQRTGRVVDIAPVGSYRLLRLRAPDIAATVRPGQFIALSVGGPESSTVLHRSFAVYATDPDEGVLGVIFSVAGPGTAWLAERRPGDVVPLVGPLGRPFPLPEVAQPAVLVGGGYGSAPLFALGTELLARGCTVEVVLGASNADRLFGVADARALSPTAELTTEDGSAGVRGTVSQVLPDVLARTGSTVVYACGPMPMLAAVAALATSHGAIAHTSVEEAMACGTGVCFTCVVPLIGDDGITRMVRSCVEGPVVEGSRVRWSASGTVPEDAYGAVPVVRPVVRPVAHPEAVAPHVAGTPAPAGTDVSVPRRRPRTFAGIPTMTTRLGPLTLPDPILTAAGTAAFGRELAPYLDVGALGAVVTASVTLAPNAGSGTPRMAETPSGMLHGIGLQNPGVEAFLAEHLPWLVEQGAGTIVSVAGHRVADYAELCRRLCSAAIDGVELNLGCTDVVDNQRYAGSPDRAGEVVAAARAALGQNKALLAKLSPDVTDLVAVARACVEAGADGLTLIGSPAALSIDRRTLRPVLPGRYGGLSGPAIRPLAVRCLYEVRAALPGVPLVGVGGVRDGLDALEMVAAGASAVAVGTTTFRDPGAARRVAEELREELSERGFTRFADAVGCAH